MFRKLFLILFLIFSFTTLAFAQETSDEDDDSFDPFADYSEFVEASTEESDLNFFKFGRLLSAGAWGGFRTFTGSMGDNNDNGNFFGLFFTFYFSLQFAAQISYTTGSHSFFLPVANPSADDIRADVNMEHISFHGKYFINTQNFTKNIAQFNPYILGGFSQIIRQTTDQSAQTFSSKDGAVSFDIGAGVEYLFNNKKAFVGFQIVYYAADFPAEGREILTGPAANIATGRDNSGDPIAAMASIGFNF